MAIYNFMTSQGFIATSDITSLSYGKESGYQNKCTFSELNKYVLPDYTINTNDISYSNSTKLFGFTRGNDTYELRFHFKNINDNYNGYRILTPQIQFYKNGTTTRFDYYANISEQLWVDRSVTKPITHFFITSPISAVTSYSYLSIYNYTFNTISIYGSSYTSYAQKGGFTVGFCTSNFTTNNTYRNEYYINNTIRMISFVIFIQNGYQQYYTNVNDYDSTIEWYLGKSVKYVGDDDISTSGGGFGTGQETSDTTEIPDTSDTSVFNPLYDFANSTSFFTHYIMSISNLQSLATHLYDSSFISQINYLFKDRPLSCIVSLRRLPFEVSSDGTKTIVLGDVDTEISSNVCKHSYHTVDCGTIIIPEVWGTALDYNPYTKISLVLPFAKTVSLNVDDVMNGEIRVKYIVDILSGDFVVFVLVNQNAKTNVLYSYTGNCAVAYPLSAEDYTQRMLAGFNLLSSVAVGGMAGGMTGMVKGGINSVGNVISAKNVHEHSGNYNGNTGFMGILKPYAIIHRPIQSLPDKIENYKGFPSNIVSTLSSLSGYTEIEDINLSVTATETEKKMIVNLLKEGVII